jgi:predicted aspartyl protease
MNSCDEPAGVGPGVHPRKGNRGEDGSRQTRATWRHPAFGPCIAALVALSTCSAATAKTDTADACRVFVLKRVGSDYSIETVGLAENETRVFPAKRETGVIDIILSVGYGTSGSLARWSEERLLIAQCVDGALQVTDRMANGKEWTRPPRESVDLARFDVRVSVTGADGTKAAFVIFENERADDETVGPVVDMFAGKIPMSDGDHTLCVDTYHHKLGPPVEGEAPLEYDRWPLAIGRLENGSEGVFIVDVGAGSTIVSKALLPARAKVEKASMVQYSAAGKKMLKYAPGGATGNVETIEGYTILPSLRFGSIHFENVRVDVIKQVPDFYGRPIAGILGIDLLRRCDALSMSLVTDGGSKPTLRMGASNAPASPGALKVPFTLVGSNLTIDGEMNKTPVHFILDTGTPDIILDRESAERIGVEIQDTKMARGRGLDGGQVDFKQGKVVDLVIANRSFGAVQPRISALSCFVILRTGRQNAGLLGNSFFSRFKRIEFDFDRRVIRFVE